MLMVKRKSIDQPNFDPDAMTGRLRTFMETYEAMENEEERRGALYYLVSSIYGNAVGERILAVMAEREPKRSSRSTGRVRKS